MRWFSRASHARLCTPCLAPLVSAQDFISWSRNAVICNKPPVWEPRFASGWQRVDGPLENLRAQILRGEAFIPAVMTSDHRTAAAFAHADLAAVDIDNGLTVDEFLEHPLSGFAAFAYTTASHDPGSGKHRFRVIFRLPRRVRDGELQKGITTILTRALGGDKSCTDPTRLFYANDKAEVPLWKPDNILPEDFLFDAQDVVDKQRTLYDEDAGEADESSIACAIFVLEQVIPPTCDGERDKFIRITAAARSGGDALFPAWSDWASRGHHGSGSRARQSTERFFRGMRGSSLGSLFFFASEADPDWRKKLPDELRELGRSARGSSDTYAGYGWEDFLGDPSSTTTAREATYGLFDPGAPWAQVATPKPETSRGSAAGYDDADFQGDPSSVRDPSGPPKRGPGRPRKNSIKDPVETVMGRLRNLYPGLRLNVVSQQLEFGPRDQPRIVPDASTTYVRISRGTGETYPKTMVNDLMQVVGYENRYNPVHSYLDHCLASQDPCPYFDALATTLIGLSDDELENPRMPDGTPLADVILRRALIGAVARTLQPGCDMDWMPILVGNQNLGKTAFYRYLVPPQRPGNGAWVTTLQQGISYVKDRPHMLHCGWIVVLDEIERYFKRRYVEELKNLVSTPEDLSAKKYQNELIYPRSFVLVGATNSRDFMQDPTGNRRFMPILARGVVPSLENPGIRIIDLDRLKADRESIWAAAYQAYLAGESWMFTSYELSLMAAFISSFGADSSIEQRVAQELTRTRTGVYRGRSFITLADLFGALKIGLEQQQSMQLAVTDAIKKAGWTMKRIQVYGRTTRVWLAPMSNEEVSEPKNWRPVLDQRVSPETVVRF